LGPRQSFDNLTPPPRVAGGHFSGRSCLVNDYLTFRRFITPILIQVIFWVTTVAIVVLALYSAAQQGGAAVVGMILIGVPLFVLTIRVYCELLIVIFKIYEALVELRGGTGAQGFPVQPPVPQPHYAPPQAYNPPPAYNPPYPPTPGTR
jgi:hypothetical protein